MATRWFVVNNPIILFKYIATWPTTQVTHCTRNRSYNPRERVVRICTRIPAYIQSLNSIESLTFICATPPYKCACRCCCLCTSLCKDDSSRIVIAIPRRSRCRFRKCMIQPTLSVREISIACLRTTQHWAHSLTFNTHKQQWAPTSRPSESNCIGNVTWGCDFGCRGGAESENAMNTKFKRTLGRGLHD